MVTVSGDATIRAGTEDPKIWQFLETDGETVVDLSAVTKITMRLRSEDTGTVKAFDTDATPTKLKVLDATNGKVQLEPAADDFQGVDVWRFHFILDDAVGSHPIPEDRDEALRVIAAIST